MLLLAFFRAFYSVYVRLLWTRRSVKDLQNIERIQTKGLAHFSLPLAVIGWTGAFADGVQRSI